MSEQPSYYAIIPASVRYARITPNAKLLYGEITALCNKTGICWASNGYFAGLYDTSNRTVQRWINELIECGFVRICGNANNPYQRGMRLCDTHDKNVVPPDNSVVAPHDKNVTHNNTSSNTTKRERAQSLEASLQGKVVNGAGCPLGWWQWASDQFKWDFKRLQTVFDTFRDHWRAQPGQKGLKADWEATWRNWCRRETTFQKPTSLAKGEVRIRETTDAEKAEADARKRFLDLARDNPRKSEAEIWEMMNHKESVGS